MIVMITVLTNLDGMASRKQLKGKHVVFHGKQLQHGIIMPFVQVSSENGHREARVIRVEEWRLLRHSVLCARW